MPLDSAERRLAAIMFTDIVGYTALMFTPPQRAARLASESTQVQDNLLASPQHSRGAVKKCAERLHMKWVLTIVGLVVGLLLAVVGVFYAASELGGDVVVLHKTLEDGSVKETRIWIVSNEDGTWIEHGHPEAHFIERLDQDPVITLEREGVARQYNATPDTNAHKLFHTLRAEQYGIADSVVTLVTGDGESCPRLPVRVELIEGETTDKI